MTMSESWQDKQHREILEVRTAIESFPDEFPLYRYPDERFRVAKPPSSFFSTHTGVQLVVQIWRRETWMDFARVSPDELRDAMKGLR